MKMPREDAADTRRRLLAAAGEVFARKGYRAATIAQICSKAGANIAAVNYHFWSKESLYREAWLQSLHESLKAHPVDGGVSADAPPEERLKGQIKALLERVADENNLEIQIVHKEMSNPTGLLNDVMREVIEPVKTRTQAVIRELLGPKATEAQVQFCEVSIISQCINPAVVRRKAPEGEERADGPIGIDDLEAYTEHVIAFSLGGISAVLEKTGSERKGSTGKSQRKGAGKKG